MNRLGITNRAGALGVRPLCDALREQIRRRLISEGKPRKEAADLAWQEMWEDVKPVLDRLETLIKHPKSRPPPPAEPKPPTTLTLLGSPEDPTNSLDPDYAETDSGCRLRDGLLWTAEQIRLVVVDDPQANTATIHLDRAATPPPSAWALFCLEAYARRLPADRAELINRIMPLASKQPAATTPPEPPPSGFLTEVG